MNRLIVALFLFGLTISGFSQQQVDRNFKKIKIEGIVIDKETQESLRVYDNFTFKRSLSRSYSRSYHRYKRKIYSRSLPW